MKKLLLIPALLIVIFSMAQETKMTFKIDGYSLITLDSTHTEVTVSEVVFKPVKGTMTSLHDTLVITIKGTKTYEVLTSVIEKDTTNETLLSGWLRDVDADTSDNIRRFYLDIYPDSTGGDGNKISPFALLFIMRGGEITIYRYHIDHDAKDD